MTPSSPHGSVLVCLCFQAALLLPLLLLWLVVWLFLLVIMLLLPPAAYGESAIPSSLFFRLLDDSRRAWKPINRPSTCRRAHPVHRRQAWPAPDRAASDIAARVTVLLVVVLPLMYSA